MRQAVVTLDVDLLMDQGFRFEAFQEAGIRNADIVSCEGRAGVVRIDVEERIDPNALDGMDAVQWWEDVANEESEHVYLLEVDATDAGDATTPDDDRHPRCEHVQVTDRGVAFTYAGSQDLLSEEISRLEATGHDVALETLRNYRPHEYPLDALTDRQREVLEVAFDLGYYDVPRRTSVEEIAAEFDLDDSTVSEHLQRAERNLLGNVLGRSP